MTKRSAMAMAAALAASLLLGVLAITWMAGGVSIANAGGQDKPVVKREVKTITVHRKAQTTSGGVRVIDLSSSSVGAMSEDRGQSENEMEGDDQKGNDDGSSNETGDDQQGGQAQGWSGDD